MFRTCARQYLDHHPVHSPFTARERWEGLKRHLTHVSMVHNYEARAAAQQQRRQLLSPVVAAQWRYSQHPHVPGLLQAYEEARRRLQLHDAEMAERRAATASVLWHCSGEQPTRWFHALGRPVVPPTPLPRVCVTPLTSRACLLPCQPQLAQGPAKQHDVAFFSGDSPCWLFRPAPTNPAVHEELLSVLDKTLSDAAARATLGPDGDGTLSSEEVEGLFSALPRGVALAVMACPTSFTFTSGMS